MTPKGFSSFLNEREKVKKGERRRVKKRDIKTTIGIYETKEKG